MAGIGKGFTLQYGAAIGVSAMGYGRTENDLDWRFINVSLDLGSSIGMGFTPEFACRLAPELFWKIHLDRAENCLASQVLIQYKWEGRLRAFQKAQKEGWGIYSVSPLTKKKLEREIRHADSYSHFMRFTSKDYLRRYIRYKRLRANSMKNGSYP